MKKIITLCCLLIGSIGWAQSSTELVPDQNPNYMTSQQYYVKFKDSLLARQNTTIQQTYKAFDWYEAKMERRETRFQQRRLNRSMFQTNPWYGWNNGWNGGGWNNGWNGGGGWNGGWNRFRFLPNISYNRGPWWFHF
jgi:hypothetical protein